MQVIPPGKPGEPHVHDFMSYGFAPKWISDYTYERLLNKLKVTQASAAEEEAFAAAEKKSYLFVRGMVLTDTASLAHTYVVERPAGTDDEPGSGEYALELRDAEDQLLFTRHFDMIGTHTEAGAPQSFHQLLPYDDATHSLVLRHGETVIAILSASDNAPAVNILTPREGVHWDGQRAVTWEASDEDGDELRFAVHYSSDNGASWQAVAIDLEEPKLELDTSYLTGSRDCLVRIIASDGLNSTVVVSAKFGVEEHEPVVSILAEPLVGENGQVVLLGEGSDTEDGPLVDGQLLWHSDKDGLLGEGQTLVSPPLSPGVHIISLTGTDTAGNASKAEVTVEIGVSIYLPVVER
jgi:hypothetical protein